MSFLSISEILEKGAQENKRFWQVVLEDDINERNVTWQDSFKQMSQMYMEMKQSDAKYEGDRMSASGLCGGDGEKLHRALEAGTLISGSFLGAVMEKAIKMGESNGCMKRIVAAPTAGSCGVIPAVLLSMEKHMEIPTEKMIEALYVASGIGVIIAERAFLAGAAGGCQAEIGSASAMAAGAAVYLMGGSDDNIANAGALALKNLLGLVCDPVAGLVEVPCVKRNVIGAVNAVTSSDLTMAGIESKIPLDEVIDAMRSIGISMHPSLKETSMGGLATTPTGLRFTEEIVKEQFKL